MGTEFYLEACGEKNLRVFQMTHFNLIDSILKYVKPQISYKLKLPNIAKVDDNPFDYENITVKIFPESKAYLMTDVDDEVDPTNMYEDEECIIVFKPKSQWFSGLHN